MYTMGKLLPENTGDGIDSAANKVANQTSLLGHACHYLYKGNNDWDKKLQKLEKAIETKCEKEEMKQKVKKNKKKILNEIEDLRRKMQKQMDDLNRKTTNTINKLELSVKESEKKTLWKIQEAEALLQNRVTAEFVDNSVKQLEDKLLREMSKQREENFGGILRNIEEIGDKIRHVDDSHCNKNKQLKKQLKEMEDMFLSKLCSLETFENNKKLVFDKFAELQKQITTLEGRGDANAIFEKIRKMINDLESQIQKIDTEEKALEVRVNELDVKIQLGMQNSEKKTEENPLSDPHKICQLEASLKRLKDEVSNQHAQYKSLETELRRQFQTLEHKVLSNFSLMRQQDGNQMSKEEILSHLERIKILCEERNKGMAKDIDDVKQRLINFGDLEKRIKKKFSELSSNNDFLKLLQQKADDEEVRREFTHTSEKLKSLNELVNQFRREFESIEQFYNQLSMLLKTNQQETISIITGNQRIIPNKCLACGTKGRQTHVHGDMKGYDGKIYKADVGSMKNTSVYEQQEVFDIMPSQLSFIQEQQQMHNSNFKQPLYSSLNRSYQKERPTSAKTDSNQDHLPTIKENKTKL